MEVVLWSSAPAFEAVEEAAAEAVRLVGDDAAVREDGAGGEHVLPFGREVGQGGDVLLPGFGIGVVVLDELVIVEILVGQAGKAVTELVDHNRLEL